MGNISTSKGIKETKRGRDSQNVNLEQLEILLHAQSLQLREIRSELQKVRARMEFQEESPIKTDTDWNLLETPESPGFRKVQQ